MEQKSYTYEIILNLLKGENHLRKIAKDLNTNHMTIKRALDNLVKENVLDVKEVGKNNVFSIKKTLEAQNLIFISEKYNFNKFIKKHPELKQELKSLKKIPARLIVIFGSYAKGNEAKESDIDVYIETQSNSIKKEASSINSKFNIKIGKYNKESPLAKEIEKNHIIIKGVELFYEKNQFFD